MKITKACFGRNAECTAKDIWLYKVISFAYSEETLFAGVSVVWVWFICSH